MADQVESNANDKPDISEDAPIVTARQHKGGKLIEQHG